MKFLRAIGVLPDFLDGHLDFQLVKQTIEWKAPARFDQVLELSIAATPPRTTSFTIGTTFASPATTGSSSPLKRCTCSSTAAR